MGALPVSAHRRWILAEAGRIRVLEPASLREKIREAGKNIWMQNS